MYVLEVGGGHLGWQKQGGKEGGGSVEGAGVHATTLSEVCGAGVTGRRLRPLQ